MMRRGPGTMRPGPGGCCKVFVQPIFSLLQSIFLIYVYKLKSAISALFWTVLVSVNQEFL